MGPADGKRSPININRGRVYIPVVIMVLRQSENPEIRKMAENLIALGRRGSGPDVDRSFDSTMSPLVDRVMKVLVDNKSLYEIKKLTINLDSNPESVASAHFFWREFNSMLDDEFGCNDKRRWEETLDVARMAPEKVGCEAACSLKEGGRKSELFELVRSECGSDCVKREGIRYLEELGAKEELDMLSRLAPNEPIKKECEKAFQRLSSPLMWALVKEIEEALESLEPKKEEDIEEVPF